MSTTAPTDAESFHQFLTRQLENGGKEKSPEELLALWRRAKQDHDKSVVLLKEAIDDMNAGDRGRPVDDVFRDIFREQGWPEE